jgi:hypothetical protein
MRLIGWLRLIPILPTTLLLTACVPDSSNVVTVVCPVIRQYDQAFLDRALAEYKGLPSGSAIKQMIGDYKVLRDRVRACRKQ